MRIVMDQHGAALRREDPGALANAPLPLDPAMAPAVAVVEARGALLLWDLRTAQSYPDALVHDPGLAAEWIADVYGSALAEALADRTGGRNDAFALASLRRPGPTLRGLRALAWLTWAEAWWPAGSRVPPLSRALLSAEIAVATSAVSHLLDDDEALERALADAVHSPGALRALDRDEALGPVAATLLHRLRELAEDFGVPMGDEEDEEETGTSAHRDDWALAAGGGTLPIEMPVLEGREGIDWAKLPGGVLDAEAEAMWEITPHGPSMWLRVAARAAPPVEFPLPEPRTIARLVARYGPVSLGISVPMRLEGSSRDAAYVAETELPASAILLRVEQRTVHVHDARYRAADAGGAGHAPAVAPAEVMREVIELARERLRRALAGDPAMSLAERAAAAHADGAAAR